MRLSRAVGLLALGFAWALSEGVHAKAPVADPKGPAKPDAAPEARAKPADPGGHAKDKAAAPTGKEEPKKSAATKEHRDEARPEKAPEPASTPEERAGPAVPSDAKPAESAEKLATAAPEAKLAVPGAVGPGAGTGDRAIRRSEGAAPDPKSAVQEPVAPGKGHRTGRAPKAPRSNLPEGAAPEAPDGDARRQIAGGPTVEELSSGKNDPELRELRDAERILFPKPLPGARAGWSWDLPAPVDDGSPEVEASGLPPGGIFRAPVSRAERAADTAWVRGLAMPNLPARLDPRVVKYLKFYRDDDRGRKILRIWAKKSGRFTPALKAELARGGLSTDLVWLSLIESGHNPTILSPAGAAGLWQFIPESARMYGLTVDRWVDERLDPARATEAAVRYLSDLRTRFGSWELAMAAYNMGHGGLLRAMRKFNTNDFWVLSRYEAGLPWETTLYVPKIFATAIAMANKKAFGIDDVEPDAAISFDTVSVGPNVELSEVARAAESTVEDIRALNAQYLTGRTPPGTPRLWPVRVPAGRALVAQQRLADAAGRRTGPRLEPHVVRFGDTLETIAAEYGATIREIAQENRVGPDERLHAGSIVLVPPRNTPEATTPPPEEVVVVPARRFAEPTRKRVFYRVLAGDRLAEVAAAFEVLPSELVLWNALDDGAQLQQGMTLQVLVKRDADLSRVRCLEEHEARVLVAGTHEFFEYFEAQNGRRRVVVTARPGDTLAAIGRKYGMSTAMMERINRLPSQTPIVPGQRIVVYTKGELGAGDGAAPSDAPGALSAISAPSPDSLPPLPPGAAPSAPNGLRAVVP